MKRLCHVVLGAIIIFSISSTLHEVSAMSDGDSETGFDEAMADAEMGGKVSGQVVRVDPMSMSLVIRSAISDDGMVTVMTRDATTYFGTTSLKTIKSGDFVSIDVIQFHDNYYADNIVMQKRYEEDDKPARLEKVLSD